MCDGEKILLGKPSRWVEGWYAILEESKHSSPIDSPSLPTCPKQARAMALIALSIEWGFFPFNKESDVEMKNEIQAKAWMENAARFGDPFSVAHCTHRGWGGRKTDVAEGTRLMRPLAEQGDAFAQNWYAVRLQYGQGVPMDKTRSLVYYVAAAEQGHVVALYNGALCFANGDGAPKNLPRAISMCARAAEDGYGPAMLWLWYYGEGKDEEKMHYLKKACRIGISSAQYAMGMHLHKIGENRKAIAWLEKGASQKNMYCKLRMGMNYWNGCGVLHDDRRGWNLLREIVGLKDEDPSSFDIDVEELVPNGVEANALYLIGWAYMVGRYVNVDNKLALHFFLHGAKCGSPNAAKEAGTLLIKNGNPTLAEYVWREAAHGGSKYVQRQLVELWKKDTSFPSLVHLAARAVARNKVEKKDVPQDLIRILMEMEWMEE